MLSIFTFLTTPPPQSSCWHDLDLLQLDKTCPLTTDLIRLLLKQWLMKFSRIQSWWFICKHTKEPIHCPDMDTLLHLINANTKHSSCFHFNTTIVLTVLFSRRTTRSFRLYLLLIFALFSKIHFSGLNILTIAPSHLQPWIYYCLVVPNRATHFCYNCSEI